MLLQSFVLVRSVTSKKTLEYQFRCHSRLSAVCTWTRAFSTHVLPKQEEKVSSFLSIDGSLKLFIPREVKYFHGVLERLERYQDSIFTQNLIMTELCDPGNLDIESMNAQDCDAMTDLELIEAFRKIVSYDFLRRTAEKCLSPVGKAIQGRLGTLSTANLIVVGKLFILWSATTKREELTSFGMSLDTVCEHTIKNHRHNLCLALHLAELCYWSGFGIKGTYLKSIVFNLLPEAKEPQHILQLAFYLNVIGHLSETSKLCSLEKKVLSVEPVSSLDELACAALGFHRTNNPLQNIDLKKAIIKQLKKEAPIVHERTLNVVCKTVRHEPPPEMRNYIIEVQKIMVQRVQELSLISLKSLLLLGSYLVAFDSYFVRLLYKRVLEDLTTIRTKDKVQFMDIYTSYTFDGIDVKILAERVNEIIREPNEMKNLQSSTYFHTVVIHYLMFSGVWPLDLIANLLSSVTQDNVKDFPRSILNIDVLMEVFHPELKEMRLSPENRRIIFESSFDDKTKLSLHPDSFNSREITKWVEFFKTEWANGDDNVLLTCIIPTNLPDLLLCVDKTGMPVSIPHQLLQYEPWEVKKIPNCFQSTDKKLIAILFVGRDARKSSLPRNQREKIMILKQLGYHVYVIRLAAWLGKDKRRSLKQLTQCIQS